MEQHGQLAGNRNPGALVAFRFRDPLTPLLERKWTLHSAQHDVRGLIERSPQHRISCLGYVAPDIAFA
jgi:hypothetical protein